MEFRDGLGGDQRDLRRAESADNRRECRTRKEPALRERLCDRLRRVDRRLNDSRNLIGNELLAFYVCLFFRRILLRLRLLRRELFGSDRLLLVERHHPRL